MGLFQPGARVSTNPSDGSVSANRNSMFDLVVSACSAGGAGAQPERGRHRRMAMILGSARIVTSERPANEELSCAAPLTLVPRRTPRLQRRGSAAQEKRSC